MAAKKRKRRKKRTAEDGGRRADDGARIVSQSSRSADTEADAERLRPLNLKSAVED